MKEEIVAKLTKKESEAFRKLAVCKVACEKYAEKLLELLKG